jgi:hypothetical protein
LVSDIGGTTTDVALLATVCQRLTPKVPAPGLRTMVEAVAMRTPGLGGDPEVHVLTSETGKRPVPGLVPPGSCGLLAVDHGPMVHLALDRWLSSDTTGEFDGRMPCQTGGLTPREAIWLLGLGIKGSHALARPSHGWKWLDVWWPVVW